MARVVPQRLLRLAFAGVGAWLVGNLFLRFSIEGAWLGRGARLGLALLSALPLFAAAFSLQRLVREELDEMLQRIVLEGLAFALLFSLAASALFVNLATAGAYVPRLDPPDLLLAPIVGVVVGVLLSSKRYL